MPSLWRPGLNPIKEIRITLAAAREFGRIQTYIFGNCFAQHYTLLLTSLSASLVGGMATSLLPPGPLPTPILSHIITITPPQRIPIIPSAVEQPPTESISVYMYPPAALFDDDPRIYSLTALVSNPSGITYKVIVSSTITAAEQVLGVLEMHYPTNFIKFTPNTPLPNLTPPPGEGMDQIQGGVERLLALTDAQTHGLPFTLVLPPLSPEDSPVSLSVSVPSEQLGPLYPHNS